MAEVTFGTNQKGYIRNNNSVYAAIHDAVNGSYKAWANTITASVHATQGVSGMGSFYVDRGLLAFDTSPLAGLIVLSGHVRLYITAITIDDGHFDVVLVNGDFDIPPVWSNFGDLLDEIISLGSINTADIALNAWNDIELNAAGLAHLNLTGITKFGLRTSYDIDDIQPAGWNNIFHPATAYPQLTVTYITVVIPTVTTNPATAVGTTSSTLKGTLDDDGGEACQCGFEWGETVAYEHGATPTQSKTTGQSFSQVIIGLDPNTAYHFRAFATNSEGTSYGADRAFTTEALPPAVIIPTVTTNPATLISQVSATLNGLLNDDGGEACDCGLEWGLTPAYGHTTLTESKVTGESFSRAIGGLTPGTTYHFRAFATNSAGTGYGADRSFTSTPTFNRAHALSREEL